MWTPVIELLDVSFGFQNLRAYFWAVMVTMGVCKDIMPVHHVRHHRGRAHVIIVCSVGTALQSMFNKLASADTLHGHVRERRQRHGAHAVDERTSSRQSSQ